MRNTLLTMTICGALLVAGCNKTDQSAGANSATPVVSGGSSVDGSSISPEDLGKLGARINKKPSDAARLLAEKGLTEKSFERAIRRVSSDPTASKRYAAAYKGAI